MLLGNGSLEVGMDSARTRCQLIEIGSLIADSGLGIVCFDHGWSDDALEPPFKKGMALQHWQHCLP